MNRDVLQGKWKQLKGNLKVKFGKLTDDDIAQTEGNEEKIVGKLQERYGYSKEQAQNEWDRFLHGYDDGSYDAHATERKPGKTTKTP